MQSLNTNSHTTVKSTFYSRWNRCEYHSFDSQKNIFSHNSFEVLDSQFIHDHLTNGTGGWKACVHSNHNLSKGMVSAQKHTLSLRSLIFIEVAL